MMSNLQTYDLAVVGSGPGGYAAALAARRRGWRVALIEREELGGVCLNVGCIPTKALITVGQMMRRIRRAQELGIQVDGVRLDYAAVRQRTQRIVSTLQQGLRSLLKHHQVELLTGQASFDDAHTLRLTHDGQAQTLACERVVLATGARPSLPRFARDSGGPWAFDGQRLLSYRDLLGMAELPTSLLIIGGGVIGCEFASCLSSLRVSVMLIEQQAQLLPTEDPEAVRVLARSLQARGVTVQTQTTVRTLTASSDGVRAVLSTGAAIEAQRCLVAVGLAAQTEGLGLEQAGVAVARGGIAINDQLITRQPHIAAIGDCVRGAGLAHWASAEGVVAVDNLAQAGSRRVDPKLVPRCIYTDPELAQIGATESECNDSVRVSRFSFAALGKSLCDEEPEGFVKLLVNASTDHVVGATIVGAHASDLIHVAALAMTHGLTAKQLVRTITAHPTLSEGITEAAAQLYGEALSTAGSARPVRSQLSQQAFSHHIERV